MTSLQVSECNVCKCILSIQAVRPAENCDDWVSLFTENKKMIFPLMVPILREQAKRWCAHSVQVLENMHKHPSQASLIK
jgi:hypothetical protein